MRRGIVGEVGLENCRRTSGVPPRYHRCVWTGVQGMSHWRCTCYVALHPLCGAAPEQKGCNAYSSGALPLGTSESVVGVCRGDCVAQWGGLLHHCCVWIGGHDRPRESAADPRHPCVWTGVQGMSRWRCTCYVAVHPLRGAAPVTWRRTRTEEVHCLRIGCSAPTHKNKRGTGTPNHSPPHPSMRSWALLVAGWARRPRRPRHHLHSGPLRHLLHP